ncbi:MAG: hypothetical protein VW270_07860 [Candidatus Poseidoniales archaeon]
MRYLIALMLLWTTAVFAQHNGIQPNEKNLPIFCGDTDHLLEGIKEKYDEEIVMLAVGENSIGHKLSHSLWINYGTKTWSFMVVNKDLGETCVMASGDNFNMFFPSKGI